MYKLICASALALCAAAPAFAAPQDGATDWTGPYVGVNVGYGGSTLHFPANASVTTGGTTTRLDLDARQTSSGVLGGGEIGYNFQTNGIVIGLEADIAASDVKGELGLSGTLSGLASGAASGAVTASLDYIGTVRARLGVPVLGGRLMPYVTGGLAYGHVKTSAGGSIGAGIGGGSFSIGGDVSKEANRTGWAAGAGIEYAITPHISMRTEYLYADLGKNTLADEQFTLGGAPVSVLLQQKTTVNMVRAGVTYRF